jgi:hypothetical protein
MKAAYICVDYIELKNYKMKNLIMIALLAICVLSVGAQETEKKSKKQLKAEKEARKIEETKALVESKMFVFDARTANPMKGSSKTLTSEYDVKITKDSIYSYLPYFGVAYTASYGGTDSPMIFDKPFDTCTVEKTKKGYTVEVDVKNSNDKLDFSFYISENGSTTLSVSSTNRQSITYYGDIVKAGEKNK